MLSVDLKYFKDIIMSKVWFFFSKWKLFSICKIGLGEFLQIVFWISSFGGSNCLLNSSQLCKEICFVSPCFYPIINGSFDKRVAIFKEWFIVCWRPHLKFQAHWASNLQLFGVFSLEHIFTNSNASKFQLHNLTT